MKQFIGIAGLPNAGKDATADLLGALLLPKRTHIIRFGDPFRAAVRDMGLPEDRETLSALSTFVRERFDPALVAKHIGRLARKSDADCVLLVGMRKFAVDVPMVRSLPCSRILAVTAPVELRYEFSVDRNRGGEATTFEQFCAQDGLETERDIRAICEQADFTVVNDRKDPSLAHIRQQLLDGILRVLPA